MSLDHDIIQLPIRLVAELLNYYDMILDTINPYEISEPECPH